MGIIHTANSVSTAREANKSLVLSLIRTEREITRIELAHRIQVSRSAISAIVGELVSEGWVIESGEGKSAGGRRPALLTFNPRARVILGIDIGPTHISALVTDLSPRVISSLEHPFDIAAGPEVGLGAIVATGRAALAQARVDALRLVGVSVGIPGGLFEPARVQGGEGNWPGWKEASLASVLRKAFKVPLMMENSTNLAALGEWNYGAGRGINHLAYVQVGTNISLTFLRGGKIVRPFQAPGEFVHRVLDENGPLCRCGQHGCLEAMASGEAMIQGAFDAIRTGHPTHLRAIASWKGILTTRDIVDAACMGDSLSRISLIEAGKQLGTAIAEIASAHKLRRVLIGGGIVQAGEQFLAPLRKSVRQRLGDNPRFEVEPASLGRYSAALGAVALACREIFTSPVDETAGYAVY